MKWMMPGLILAFVYMLSVEDGNDLNGLFFLAVIALIVGVLMALRSNEDVEYFIVIDVIEPEPEPEYDEVDDADFRP